MVPDTQAAADARRHLRMAVWLVAGTLGYNVVEGVVAVWCGRAAGSSVLVAFGLDSGIECVAAGVLLWRLRAPLHDERREAAARRIVGWTFIALTLYVIAEVGMTFFTRDRPRASVVGVVLGVASLIVMPGLSWAKLRVAARLGSKALRAEALETLACTYLSATLLVGLVANATLGWWWADPVAALLMVPWLVREGLEGIAARECAD